VAAIARQSGLDITGATPVLLDLTVGDLVSGGAPDYDPNVIMDAPLTVGALGTVRVRTTEQGTARGSYQNGAIFLLNHLPLWNGNGNYAYIAKLTPTNHPGVTYPAFGFGFMDQGGNPMAAGVRCQIAGIEAASVANLVPYYFLTATAGTTWGTAHAFAAHTPSLNLRYMPCGAPGDAASVGARPCRYGAIQATWRHDPNVVNAVDNEGYTTGMSGGFRPFLSVNWRTTGADVCDWTIRVQWAAIPAFPVGSFP
jgi:hypothetical protein